MLDILKNYLSPESLKNYLSPESSQFFYWEQLPDEIKIITLSKLDILDINNMSLVSKKTNNLIKDENIFSSRLKMKIYSAADTYGMKLQSNAVLIFR